MKKLFLFFALLVPIILSGQQGNTYRIGNNSALSTSQKDAISGYVDAEVNGAVGNASADNYAILQSLITNNANKRIRIGDAVTDTFVISRPLVPISNTVLEINGVLQIKDGTSRSLTQNMAIGDKTAVVASADTYFDVGQWVSISDSDRPVQGGSSQTRKTSSTAIITAINADTITLEYGVVYAFTTASSAKIGQTQSVIVCDSVSNVTISGSGVIDANWHGQYDVEPIKPYNGVQEEVRASCGISMWYCNNMSVSGVTIVNAGLHGIASWLVDSIKIDDIVVKDIHDKAILFAGVTNAIINNSDIQHTIFEDGITLYINNYDVLISNIRISNCARYSIAVNSNTERVSINNIIAKNTSYGIVFNDETTRNCSVTNATLLNTGILVYEGQNLSFNNVWVSLTSQITAISISQNAKNVTFTGGGVSSATAYGKGLVTSSSITTHPYGVRFTNFTFRNCTTALTISSGSQFIVFDKCYFVGNTSLGTGYTTSNVTLTNNIGLSSENYGSSTIVDDSTGIWVNHLCGITPRVSDIIITPTNNLGTAAGWWVSDIGSAKFRINIDADPGGNATFSWTVKPQSGTPVSDSDATAFILASGITNATQISAINNLVVALKANSLWDSITAIYPMVGGTATTHKFNLKDARDDSTAYRLTFGGTPTHGATGVQFVSGTSSYAKTYLIPNTALVANNTHVGFYCGNNSLSTTIEFGALTSSTARWLFYLYNSANTVGQDYDASNGVLSVAVTDTRGFWIDNKGIGTHAIYKNGTSIASNTTAITSTLPTHQVYFGAYNNAGTAASFSGKLCQFATIGNAMSATEAANLSTIVNAFQTELGRNVY